MGLKFGNEQFEDVYEDWWSLLSSCNTDTIFLTPLWQKIWWKHFRDGWSLSLCSLRDDDQLIGLAPLAIKDGVIRFIGGKDLFDYHDFLTLKGQESKLFEALFEYMNVDKWRLVELHSIPEGSPTLEMVEAYAGCFGYSVTVEEEDKTPSMSLPESWDNYVSGLSRKYRHELRRKLRRIGSSGEYVQHNYRRSSEVRYGMEDFFRLHALSSPEKAIYMTAPRKTFFLEMADRLSEDGMLVLSLLEFEGVKVAACINFDYKESYLLYNSGYDPDYSDLSVGLINTALTIKDAIDVGKTRFDFLRGTERYKYHLGADDRTIYTVILKR